MSSVLWCYERVEELVRKYRPVKRHMQPAVWITAYDYPTALAAEFAGVDMVLVGDSGLMVQYGCSTTVTGEATIDTMLLMTRAVRRGAPTTYLVGDMPIGSYESSDVTAVENAIRFIRDGGADAVKLEGGMRMAERVRAIAGAGIAVIGHIGLTPQTTASLGGYRVQGRVRDQQAQLESDILALEEAGAQAVLVEAVPANFGGRLAKSVGIPVFGIGAGPDVDGQLLIFHDVVGMYPDFRPSFATSWFEAGLARFHARPENGDDPSFGVASDGLLGLMGNIVSCFVDDVRAGSFPSADNSYA